MNRLASMAWWPLLLFILFAPLLHVLGLSNSGRGYALPDWQRMFEVLAVMSSLLLGAYAYSRQPIVANPRQMAGWALFFGLGLVSCLTSLIPNAALLEWSWTLSLLLCVFFLRQPRRDLQYLDATLSLVLLSTVMLYTTVFFLRNSDALFEPGSFLALDFHGVSNIRVFSDYQSPLLLLAPYATFMQIKGKLYRPIGSILIGFFFSLAFLAGSRSVLAAHATIHVLLLCLIGRPYYAFLREQAKFWLFGFILYEFYIDLIPALWSLGAMSLDHEISHQSSLANKGDWDSGRLQLWSIALQMAIHHPWLGVGPMHFSAYPNPIAAGPHNLMLQISAEWGIPAMGIFTMLCIGFFRNQIIELRHTSDHTAGLTMPMLAASLVLLCQSTVAGSMQHPLGQGMAVLCFSYLTIKAQNTLPPTTWWREALDRAQKFKFFSILSVSIVAMCTALLMPWIGHIPERNNCQMETQWPLSRFAPRFWLQGWISGPCGAISPSSQEDQE